MTLKDYITSVKKDPKVLDDSVTFDGATNTVTYWYMVEPDMKEFKTVQIIFRTKNTSLILGKVYITEGYNVYEATPTNMTNSINRAINYEKGKFVISKLDLPISYKEIN